MRFIILFVAAVGILFPTSFAEPVVTKVTKTRSGESYTVERQYLPNAQLYQKKYELVGLLGYAVPHRKSGSHFLYHERILPSNGDIIRFKFKPDENKGLKLVSTSVKSKNGNVKRKWNENVQFKKSDFDNYEVPEFIKEKIKALQRTENPIKEVTPKPIIPPPSPPSLNSLNTAAYVLGLSSLGLGILNLINSGKVAAGSDHLKHRLSEKST